MRTDAVLLFLPRVRMGDSGGDDGRTAAAVDLPDGDDGAARFAARAGEPRSPPPPLTVPGLAAAPRLTGVDLGDTGGFLVDVAVVVAAAAVRLLGTGIRELFFALEEGCLPASGCCLVLAAAAAAAMEARRVEGRVRRDCAARRGVGELGGAPLPFLSEEEALSRSSSRARLMFLNCRLMSGVWEFIFRGVESSGEHGARRHRTSGGLNRERQYIAEHSTGRRGYSFRADRREDSS